MPDSTAQAAAPAPDGGCLCFAPQSAERVRVRSAIDFNTLKRLLDDADCRSVDVAMLLEKVVGDRACKILDRFQGVLFGQGKGHVFHRVRGYNQAVVATGIRSSKISFELDLDRQLADIVTVGQTRDLGNANP